MWSYSWYIEYISGISIGRGVCDVARDTSAYSRSPSERVVFSYRVEYITPNQPSKQCLQAERVCIRAKQWCPHLNVSCINTTNVASFTIIPSSCTNSYDNKHNAILVFRLHVSQWLVRPADTWTLSSGDDASCHSRHSLFH